MEMMKKYTARDQRFVCMEVMGSKLVVTRVDCHLDMG